MAKQLGIDPERVRVVSRFVGGAFGSKGIADRAHRLDRRGGAPRSDRPVKLVATRDQGYTIATYRAETRHHIQLGADARRQARRAAPRGLGGDVAPLEYNVSGTETTARMYACPNIATKVNVVHADRNTPGFMRAPPDTPYMFALESRDGRAGLCARHGPDRAAPRSTTRADRSGRRAVPYSSRSLMPCFDRGRRALRLVAARPPARRRCATATGWWAGAARAAAYPANIGAGAARVSLGPDGQAAVQIAGARDRHRHLHDRRDDGGGPAGPAVEHVTVQLGDSDLPPAGLAAGSSHAAGVCNAVAAACEEIRARVARGRGHQRRRPVRRPATRRTLR